MSEVTEIWPKVIEVPLGEGVRPLRFRRILAGGVRDSFRMGQRGGEAREEPVHEVTLEGPFYLAEVPVTQAQFEVWTRSEEYREWFSANAEKIKRSSYSNDAKDHSNYFPDQSENPAEQVTWWEAMAFGDWLKESNLLSAGLKEVICKDPTCLNLMAGLPSEAQWEYACRAGSETDYWNGDGEAALEAVGWFDGNAEETTHPVGEKREGHPFVLYDMHGNVWEWCLDEWDENSYRLAVSGVEEPRRGESEAYRVLRGGSWSYSASFCRSAYRDRCWPGYRYWSIGFRLGLFPGPDKQEGPEAPMGAQAGQGGTTQTALEREWGGAVLPKVSDET